MVTQQAGDDDLQKADTVVAREGTVNGVGLNPLDGINLSSKDNDREIETKIAMRRDHKTEREEQDNRMSSLDVNLADNRAGLDRSEATQRYEEDKPSKIDEADFAEAPVYYHESGDLFAEDIEQHLAVLPEMSTATEKVTINDIKIGDPDVPLTIDQQRLRSLIWKSCHLLMGNGNAPPLAARGAICDIDVGEPAPIAQRVRPVAPKYREKLSDLIKGLLAAKIVQLSTLPWASPIVVIIKKDGVDIRLCIYYRRVNQLTRLMVYPMPLISDLLEDLDKALWFCSLDMASAF
uniref:Reverse transcriptase domain-containing protein n=1 Tax=Peronospora matthiolae TaxID=2874970 RepID=A0AAV1VEX1_9STRA